MITELNQIGQKIFSNFGNLSNFFTQNIGTAVSTSFDGIPVIENIFNFVGNIINSIFPNQTFMDLMYYAIPITLLYNYIKWVAALFK